MLKTHGVRMWTGCIWLNSRFGDTLWKLQRTFRFCNGQGITWQGELLL